MPTAWLKNPDLTPKAEKSGHSKAQLPAVQQNFAKLNFKYQCNRSSIVALNWYYLLQKKYYCKTLIKHHLQLKLLKSSD